MRSAARFLLIATVTLAGFTSCEKSRAKFRPGDRVVERSDRGKHAVLYLRFNTNEPYYYLKVPGPPPKESSGREGAFDDRWKDNLQWHIEGPFCDNDLDLAN